VRSNLGVEVGEETGADNPKIDGEVPPTIVVEDGAMAVRLCRQRRHEAWSDLRGGGGNQDTMDLVMTIEEKSSDLDEGDGQVKKESPRTR
jgi:hypothetical protein